jgi:GGDEF domain-containing protein
LGSRRSPEPLRGSITDIDERKRREAEIENLAFYDQLTGLPNRTLAIDITRHALSSIAQGSSAGSSLSTSITSR